MMIDFKLKNNMIENIIGMDSAPVDGRVYPQAWG
jgi:hypothetical protein